MFQLWKGIHVHISKNKREVDIEKLAGEIVAYLQQRELAADTLAGQWWLMRQRYIENQKLVEQAVEYLFEKGMIEKRVMADGTVLYLRNKDSSSKHH